MYCSQLLALKNDLPNEELQKIDDFLRSNQYNPYITISMANKYTNIPENIIAEIFNKLCCSGVLNIIYALSCPECGHLIKSIQRIAAFDFETIDHCYSCNKSIACCENDVMILYEQKISFKKGQFHKGVIDIDPNDISPCDTLKYIADMNVTFRSLLNLEKSKYDELEKGKKDIEK